jgi:hypothetical protein
VEAKATCILLGPLIKALASEESTLISNSSNIAALLHQGQRLLASIKNGKNQTYGGFRMLGREIVRYNVHELPDNRPFLGLIRNPN